MATSSWRESRASRALRRAPRSEPFKRLGSLDKFGLAVGLLLLLVILGAPLIAPHDPTVPVGTPLSAPGHEVPLGTDEVGRDMLSRIVYGARLSVVGALIVTLSGVIVGGTVGLAAGARGGWVDSILMRVTDTFLALPAPVIAIAIVTALGPSFGNTLFAVAVVWWPLYARLVRGEVRALNARPHMESARLGRISLWRLWLRHLLPGTLPVIVIAMSLDIGILIVTLAGLSFLGLGALQPAPELGAMAARGLPYLLTKWWIPILPSAAVFLLAFVSNLVGDGLRDLMGYSTEEVA